MSGGGGKLLCIGKGDGDKTGRKATRGVCVLLTSEEGEGEREWGKEPPEHAKITRERDKAGNTSGAPKGLIVGVNVIFKSSDETSWPTAMVSLSSYSLCLSQVQSRSSGSFFIFGSTVVVCRPSTTAVELSESLRN